MYRRECLVCMVIHHFKIFNVTYYSFVNVTHDIRVYTLYVWLYITLKIQYFIYLTLNYSCIQTITKTHGKALKYLRDILLGITIWVVSFVAAPT